jgi:hypothetical protein
MADLLEDVSSLPEEEAPQFSSSGRVFEVNSEDGHPMLKAIGIFVIIISGFGMANGLDYINPHSGLVRPHEWIYAMSESAPLESSTFYGTVLSGDEPVAGASITISMRGYQGMRVLVDTEADSNGFFEFTNVSPGLTTIKIIRWQADGEHDAVQHRMLINPPTLFESVGFTKIDFDLPAEKEFSNLNCQDLGNGSCLREINFQDQEMEFPLLDGSAAGMYILVGWGIIGLSTIALGFSIIGMNKGSRGMIRTGAVLVIFTMGHYYSACILGLMAFALTFSIPAKRIRLDA